MVIRKNNYKAEVNFYKYFFIKFAVLNIVIQYKNAYSSKKNNKNICKNLISPYNYFFVLPFCQFTIFSYFTKLSLYHPIA